jgi:guanylate kinase
MQAERQRARAACNLHFAICILQLPAFRLPFPSNMPMAVVSPGKLIVVSGPSGSGKTTLLARLLTNPPGPVIHAVSATTRPPRPGERHGVDYYFLTQEEFDRRKAVGEFLECFEVFGRGHWYGTLRSEVAPSLAAGKWVILEIDVNGMMAVVREYPQAVTIFVRPGSLEDLQRRLTERGTETPAAIERRLAESRREMSFADRYQYQVVNDDLEHAVGELARILKQT